jgi:EAL domain-containing protein (putative c-di-GMP-specific phosphodiesterase class I)
MRRLLDARPNGRRNVFSINLSGSTLCDDRFFQFLRDELAFHAVPPEDACFEITETAAVTNLVHATSLMQRFRTLGCRFVLDDFGAGLSSFTYLKDLPVDGIKMDGAFVRGISTNPIDASMVQAINNIGHVMGLTTTAEFVEDAAILAKLIELGVDYGQGNSLHIPCPAEEWFAPILDQPAAVSDPPRWRAVSRAAEG